MGHTIKSGEFLSGGFVKGNGKGLNKGMIYGKEGEKNESSLI
jgi:hypothetical protein